MTYLCQKSTAPSKCQTCLVLVPAKGQIYFDVVCGCGCSKTVSVHVRNSVRNSMRKAATIRSKETDLGVTFLLTIFQSFTDIKLMKYITKNVPTLLYKMNNTINKF